MKKLPKIYQNKIDKNIFNNKEKCYVETNKHIGESADEMDISLDEVFSGLGYSYNIPLIIKTKEKEYKTSLIAKTKKNIVTIDNEVIPINEIISIKKKKN